MPKGYIEQHGMDYFSLHPVGSGPFKFVRYVSGDEIKYEALDKHWQQTAAFKNVTLIKMPDESTREATLKTGQVDAIECDLDSAAELEAAGMKTVNMNQGRPGINLVGAYYPDAKYPTTDIRVRQALSLAINREELNNTLFHGKLGPCPPPLQHAGIADLDNDYWMKYCANIYRYDPAEAQRLLNEAGYSQGFNITLYASPQAGAPDIPKLAEVIQSYWLKIGVKAVVLPTDWAIVKQYRNSLKSTVALGAAYFDYAVGSPIAPKNLTQGFHSGGTAALLGKSMPELDKLIDSSWVEGDASKRQEMLAQATKMTTDAYVVIQIGSSTAIDAIGPRVGVVLPAECVDIALYANFFTHR
jgi:peptide/nickel transport system substrate-binding protein